MDRVAIRQLVRYGVVGMVSNTAGYVLYLFITYAGVEPKQTASFFYATGAAIGFIGNRKWVFSHRGLVSTGTLRYAIAHLFGYLINISMLIVFTDMMGYPHQWVQACAILVVAVFLFFVFRFFVFPKTNSEGVSP